MSPRKKSNDDDDGYALDLTGAVRHVATKLGQAEDGAALSIDDLATGYTHFSGDLVRVKTHQNLATDAEAIVWLIRRAVEELTRNGKRGKVQLAVDEGWVSLAPGVTSADLKWRGQQVYATRDVYSVLGDPFDPMSGRYADNVRKNTGKDDLTDLEMSMRAVGWLPNHPAVKDARTKVTISGHRRLKAAAKLRAEGVDIQDNIRYVNFEAAGEGDLADVARLDEAFGSNFGFRQTTPEERAEAALWLSEKRDMTQQQIAAALGVSQQTVSRDLVRAVTQMSSRGDLDELIAAATSGIKRGLNMAQVGRELNLKHDSLPLAKAYAVALDRLNRQQEPEPKLPVKPVRQGLEDMEDPEPMGDEQPETTLDRVRGAIREAEEVPLDRPHDVIPGSGELGEPKTLGSSLDEGDFEPSASLSRPAVNPPRDLPPAPVSAVQGQRDNRYSVHDLTYHQARAEQLARQLDPGGRNPDAPLTFREIVADAWEDSALIVRADWVAE